MTNAVKLFCAGILPLLVGLIFNFIILNFPFTGIPVLIIELALIIGWGFLAFRASNSEKHPMMQAFLLSAFGLLMLALVLYQELGMGQYWGNYIGFGTQIYFLPLLSLVSSIMSPFMTVIRIWPMYIVIWAVMFLAGCAGCYMKRGR